MIRRVYIAHPLGSGPGREANRQRASRWVAWAALLENVSPCATWVILSGVWPESPACRDKGLEGDLKEIDKCDEVWLCGDGVSPGMQIERDHALSTGKVVYDMTTKDGEPPGVYLLGEAAE